MFEDMYSETVVKVNNFIFLLLIYVFTSEKHFPILVNDSFGETNSSLFSAEIMFSRKNLAAKNQPAELETQFPYLQRHMKHGLSGAAVIELHS